MVKREAELRVKRDKSHIEQVERWANFVKNNPDKWKKEHSAFINTKKCKAFLVCSRIGFLTCPNQ